MKRKRLLFTFMTMVATVLAIYATPNEIQVHTGGGNHGNDQIYVEPPQVTYDDDLNELYVYFGSTGTIDIEYVDALGTPYYYVYHENHTGYSYAVYNNLPSGYYTITIHSIYGYTYYGNFTVS